MSDGVGDRCRSHCGFIICNVTNKRSSGAGRHRRCVSCLVRGRAAASARASGRELVRAACGRAARAAQHPSQS
eukprot:5683803-Prymnesium_polylepis.1